MAFKDYGCPSCSGHYDTTNELGNHLDENHTPEARPEVDTSFESLKNESKWTLSTGTVVEDQSYEFVKLQIREHPSQFFIFDVNDSELYIKHGSFTSAADIRKALLQKESWEDSYLQDKHFDLDWIQQSIQEYELDSFANDHSENWYNGYFTRVNEGNPLQIPSDGEKVLPILVQVYHLKQMARSVYQNARFSQTSPNNAKLARTLLRQAN
ncbi:hypothetical protein BDB01DRAFT_908122 [Pilobolus umbonatus]|nr:hypothetical protein BDB01DRAFT_908122 [Pilobolus umbonatus]